ncbi:MAG: methyltransferase domain-containing protein [Cyanobacteria bacterium]|jgi:ubiquinone/menaquinone biosynthesis C-methylase UbiE|nr:methyltransferase domain-containing protein [Cyanobacteria bacterium GSL.Bin21]
MKVNSTYEPYSQQAEYLNANRELLKTLPLESVNQVLDLACGTGIMSSLLFELKPQVSIIAVDISKESLEIGRKKFAQQGLLANHMTDLKQAEDMRQGAILMLEESADNLPFEPQSFDLVIMGGAIHLLPDKTTLIKHVGRVLRPTGFFTFNTAYYVGTYVEGTESFYSEWLKEALVVMEEKNKARRAEGKQPFLRKRGTVGRAFNKGWMSPQEWIQLLNQNGMKTIRSEQRTVVMPQSGFESLVGYGGLAEVLMSGYPVDVAGECLQIAARRTFEKMGLTELPRRWYENTAVPKC